MEIEKVSKLYLLYEIKNVCDRIKSKGKDLNNIVLTCTDGRGLDFDMEVEE